MKKTIIWSIVLCSLLATSCLERPFTPIVPIDENFFDWKTVSTLNLNVQVDAMSGDINNYARTVNIYSSALFDKSSLMVSGSSLPNKPFQHTLILPTSFQKVYVEIVYPTGAIKQYVQKVTPDMTEISVDTRCATTKADEGITIPQIDVPEWGPIPSTFNIILNKNFNNLSLSGNNTYYVPEGVNISGQLSCGNYNYGKHAVLYIAGKLTITGNAEMVRSSIVVLDGGELIIKNKFKSYGYVESPKPILYIMEGGKASISTTPNFDSAPDISIEGTNIIVNKGELVIGNHLGCNMGFSYGTPSMYNTGSIKGYDNSFFGGLYITVSNGSSIYNDGDIYADNLSMSNTGTITNYSSGNMNVDEYSQGNTTNTLTNYGQFHVDNADIKGTVNNSGYVGVESYFNLLDNAALNNSYGSLLQVNMATLTNSSINMGDGSIVSFNDLRVFSSGYIIQNYDDAYSLLIINENLYMRNNCYIDGDVEVWHKNLGSIGNNLNRDYKNKYGKNVKWIKNIEDRITNIPANEYNKGLGEITPPAPIDNDGDGVMSDVDIDDNDPTIAYRSYFPNNTEYGTIMVEDLWPYPGDYDMNDIVCDYHIEWTSNAQNQVVYLEYFWKLRAVGSTKKLAMAVQLDSIPVSYVSSVVTTHPIEGDLPLSSVDGMEPGQYFPVIPLFNDPAELFGESTLINTIPDYPLLPISEHSFKVVFTEPVNPAIVNLNRINPFVVVTDFDRPTREWEIHMPGFKRTNKASTVLNNKGGLSQADPYLTNTGMMWMFRVPKSIGYTIELINIEDAYTHYRLWYQSKGTNYNDWYITPIDQTKLYPQER